jgi:hypothetical protein
VLRALVGYVRRHHIGLIALFVALGGTAYAASLPRNSVGTKQLKPDAVTSAKVRNGALKAADFATGTLLTGPQGATGPRGLTGPPGSDAQFNGATAGGDLTGTFPNPTLKTVPAAAVRQGPGEVETLADGVIVDIGNGLTGKLTFENYDTANVHDNATPEQFTAPRTGAYLASGAVNFGPSAIGKRSLGFAINGIACCGGVQLPAAANTLFSTSAIVPLVAGEHLTLKGGPLGAGAPVDASQVEFAIQWLGPIS